MYINKVTYHMISACYTGYLPFLPLHIGISYQKNPYWLALTLCTYSGVYILSELLCFVCSCAPVPYYHTTTPKMSKKHPKVRFSLWVYLVKSVQVNE